MSQSRRVLNEFNRLMLQTGPRRYFLACAVTVGMALGGIQVVALAAVVDDGSVASWIVALLVFALVVSHLSSGVFYRELASLEERLERQIDLRILDWSSHIETSELTNDDRAIRVAAVRPYLSNAAGAILYGAEVAIRTAITAGVLIWLGGVGSAPMFFGALVGAWLCQRSFEERGKRGPAGAQNRSNASAWLSVLCSANQRAEVASIGSFDQVVDRWRDSELAQDRAAALHDARAALQWLAGIVIYSLGAAGALYLVLTRVAPDQPSWLVAAVAVLVIQTQRQLAALASSYGWIVASFGAVVSLLDVPDTDCSGDAHDTPTEGQHSPSGPQISPVVIDAASFTYDNTSRGVNDLSMRLEPATVVGISGENGVGKTTIAGMILGYNKPASGEIVGVPARRCAVFQDFGRFALTVAESVDLGPLHNYDDLTRAARIAQFDEVVDEISNGWETQLRSEQMPFGDDISTGQWQRLAISRAAFHALGEPSITVMDEPTRFLDEDLGHKLIKGWIEAWRSTEGALGSILLIISHRAEDLQPCDTSYQVTIENGKTVARTTRTGEDNV